MWEWYITLYLLTNIQNVQLKFYTITALQAEAKAESPTPEVVIEFNVLFLA